jgi:hypothetical protein
MAAKTNVQEAREQSPAAEFSAMAVIAPAVGWLVPGMGHIVQKRWVRGIMLFVSVFALSFLGLAMQGKVYTPNAGDILDMLGFIGDVGAGGFYIVSQGMGWGQGAVHQATADYGTKYMIVAGLLNLICVVDAYHIALRKKN